jgi:hypothetical protein
MSPERKLFLDKQAAAKRANKSVNVNVGLCHGRLFGEAYPAPRFYPFVLTVTDYRTGEILYDNSFLTKLERDIVIRE